RVVRARLRRAAGARAAGRAADVQVPVDGAGTHQRHRGQQDGAREAPGVPDVARRRLGEVLGQRTAEFAEQFGCAVRLAVHAFPGAGVRIAEIRGRVDHAGVHT